VLIRPFNLEQLDSGFFFSMFKPGSKIGQTSAFRDALLDEAEVFCNGKEL
jgi:hypothetical protein